MCGGQACLFKNDLSYYISGVKTNCVCTSSCSCSDLDEMTPVTFGSPTVQFAEMSKDGLPGYFLSN